MMKKNLLTLAAVLCCAMTMTVLTACTDNEDNPTDPAEEPSAVDNGAWNVTAENMDKSVRPGDDFFLYCNGGYWKNTVADESKRFSMLFMGKISDEMKKREAALTLPSKTKALADAALTDAATIAAQKAKLKSAIDRVNALTTIEETWELLAQLYSEGYRTPMDITNFGRDGKMAVAMIQNASKDYEALQLWSKQSMSWRLSNDPSLLMRPLKSGKTRSFDNDEWPLMVTFFNTLGYSLDDVYTADQLPNVMEQEQGDDYLELMKSFQDMGVDDWKEGMIEALNEDAVFFDEEAAAAASTTCQEALNNFFDKYLKYELSRAFALAYVSAGQKQTMTGYAEELRQTFREAIQQYDWMSEVSKQNATEKINNMIFNIGAPDEWFEEGIADLSQEQTLYDDIRAMRRAKVNLTKKLTGMSAKRASFHYIITDMPLTTVNACYVMAGNYMNILPAYMLNPTYDPEQNTAHNYANMMTWGHEIIHGFDTQGAKYNQHGNPGSLWGSEADSQEFERRAQQLIEFYNTLDILPLETGLKNDGAYTVAENVADLGGFFLAYESYLKYLKKHGFTGDQLRLQKQRFFEAYGYLWGGKWTAAEAQRRTVGLGEDQEGKDNHSMFHERVNGIVTNCDDWYDLFGVKEGDKLYLAPNKRIRIW